MTRTKNVQGLSVSHVKWLPGFALMLVLLALAAFSASNASLAYAQNPTPNPDIQNRMEKIAKDLYCPVCVGVPLNVCDTQACEQWRQLIIQKLQAGESEQQIRDYFISQYGDRVLGAPPPQGFNLGAYVLPVLILLAGAAILFFTLRGWLRKRQATNGKAAATTPSIAPEYAERIARELKELE